MTTVEPIRDIEHLHKLEKYFEKKYMIPKLMIQNMAWWAMVRQTILVSDVV